MRNKLKNMAKCSLVVLLACLIQNCIEQDLFRLPSREIENQCTTPIKEIAVYVAPGGISTTSDGSLIAMTTGSTFLYTNEGELLWTKKGIGGIHALILSDGTALLAELYNKEEPWKGAVIKLDTQGNILWEKQVGSMGFDGLAVTPDGSFIAVGAADREKNGYLMLFSEDGSKLWDHQIDGRVETVAVSKNGYVAAGSRDAYIYLYDKNGQLIFSYFAMNAYSSQDTAISPDESFFLFGSEYRYLNCYTLEGRFLWQNEVGDLSNIRISADGEYIAVGTYSELLLIDRDGNELWSKKVSCTYIHDVAISIHGEYIAIDTLRDFYSNPKYYTEVYSRKGELLWRFQNIEPFTAIAMSDDGPYIAAGSKNIFVIFDSFQAIEEYSLSECAQQDRSSFFAI